MANNNFVKTPLSLTSPICMDINDNVVRPFDSFNKKNAPFIGDQLSPFYVEEEKAVDGEVTPVYDNVGNKWSLINNKLCKNGEVVQGSIPFEKTFSKTQIESECFMSRRIDGVLYEAFKKLIYKKGSTYWQVTLTNGAVTETFDIQIESEDLILGADIIQLKDRTNKLAVIYSDLISSQSKNVTVSVILYNLDTLELFSRYEKLTNAKTSAYTYGTFDFKKIFFVNITTVIVNGSIEGIGLSFCTRYAPYSMIIKYVDVPVENNIFDKDSLYEVRYNQDVIGVGGEGVNSYILFVNGEARDCPRANVIDILDPPFSKHSTQVYNLLNFTSVSYKEAFSQKVAFFSIQDTRSPEVPCESAKVDFHVVLYPNYYNIFRHWKCVEKETKEEGNLTLRFTNGFVNPGDVTLKKCGWNPVKSLNNPPSIYRITERDNKELSYFGVNINNDYPNSIISNNYNLIIPWNEIKDSIPILTFRENSELSFYYTDKNDVSYLVKKDVDPYIVGIFDDRYILINSDNVKNVYDIKDNMFHKWSSGYNGTLQIGILGNYEGNKNDINKDLDAFIFGASYNPLYEITKVPFTSPAFAYSNLIDVKVDVINTDLDLFYSNSRNSLVPLYYRSVKTSLLGKSINYINQGLIELQYPFTDNIIYSPSLFSKFFTTLNNHDFLFNGTDFYPLIYSNNIRLFAYRAFAFIENINTAFVLQSNNYVVTNDKILSVQYQGSQLTNITPVCSITGMTFIGNTSQVAFFYSYLSKKIYIFTGDTVLREQRGANIIDEVYSTFFIPADNTIIMSCREYDGIETAYFFGSDSFLRLEIPKIKNCFFGDNKIILIDNNNNARKLSYFKNPNGKKIPIELQTGYFGIGNEMSSVIDCWYIRVFDEDKGSGDVTISQNTLTNIGAKTESKTIHINPGDWDKQTNSYLIRYQPRYQNGVGIQLNLVSDFSIYEIVVSSRQGETQLTSPKAQI